MTTPLTLTGERTAPGIWHENYWFRRHEVAYAAVPGLVSPLTSRAPSAVLDAGSGEGYAAGLLSSAWRGARVVGVDYDAVATAHAARAHAGEHAAYLRGALTALPVADATFDVTVSMQVLEHIWTPAEFVRELARVTRAGGALVVSTPNRLTFSPGLERRARPVNAYHCREYDAAELGDELARWLPGADVTLHGIHHAQRLVAWAAGHGPIEEALAAQPARWPATVRALVESVTTQDFAIGEASDDCLDLVAVVANPARTVRG